MRICSQQEQIHTVIQRLFTIENSNLTYVINAIDVTEKNITRHDLVPVQLSAVFSNTGS